MNIKKGDNVIVIAGKDKGKQGKIIKVVAEKNGVVIAGVNIKNKRQRPRRSNEKGQVMQIPHPIDRSNVQPFCSTCNKGVRIKMKITKDKKARVCAKCGREI